MKDYKPLYLANNIEALNTIASKDLDFKRTKPKIMINALKRFGKYCNDKDYDQELSYIHLYKYSELYKHLVEKADDRNYIETLFEGDYLRISIRLAKLAESLERRYTKPKVVEEPCLAVKRRKSKDEPLFETEFISCEELYSALADDYNVLVVDCRPQSDFEKSRMISANCINVPEHLITLGQSANTIGKNLTAPSSIMWEKRNQFHAIVLLHWDYTLDSHKHKIKLLRAALVQWDINRTYRQRPVILKDGYLLYVYTYPTHCSNPHVYLSRANTELDELLDIDDIVYPIEADKTAPILEVSTDRDVEPRDAQEEEQSQIINKTVTSPDDMKDLQSEKKILGSDSTMVGDDIDIKWYQDNIKEIEEEMEFYKTFKDENTLEDESTDLSAEVSEKLKLTIRQEELDIARAKKPTYVEKKPTHVEKKPTVDRDTKPETKFQMPPMTNIGAGLIGMRNIRNTCYMNAIMQCLAHVPEMRRLFCGGIPATYKLKQPGAIFKETFRLVRALWSSLRYHFTPNDFYKQICAIQPNYGQGNHEDTMEFYIFLINLLIEDCTYFAQVPITMTPKQMAWYKEFDGRYSIFLEIFYHQIRTTQYCKICHKTSYKFETESSFMLAVPNEPCDIKTLLRNYMNSYVSQRLVCNKCKQPVENIREFTYEPEVVVVILKRYRQITTNGQTEFVKNNCEATFPVDDLQLSPDGPKYHLYAMALHTGTMNAGHYTAICKVKSGWFEFNDERVRPINISDPSIKTAVTTFFYSKNPL